MRTRQVLEREVAAGSAATLPAVLAALPWLLGRFCAALRRARRPGAAAEREDPASAERGESAPGAATAHLPPSADYDFFAVLLRPLLACLSAAVSAGGMGGGGSDCAGSAGAEATAGGTEVADGRAPEGRRKRRRRSEGLVDEHPARKRVKAAEGGRGGRGRDGAPLGDQAGRWVAVAEGAAQLVAALRSAGTHAGDPAGNVIEQSYECTLNVQGGSVLPG